MLSKNVFRLAATGMVVAGVLGGASGTANAGAGSCSQPVSSGAEPVASDCLYILKAAVGSVTPAKACITQPKGTAPTRASDALICLSYSVGQTVSLDCPCGIPDMEATDYTFDPDTDVADSAVAAKFVKTTYLGAFSQDQTTTVGDWTKDWTVEVHGNHKVWHPATEGTLNGATPSANAACPTGTTLVGTKSMPSPYMGSMDLCELPDRFDDNGGTLTLTNDNIYLVNSASTLIGNGDGEDKNYATSFHTTLAIEPGTLTLGGDKHIIAITRGSSIQANGTRLNPIVMDSENAFDLWVGGDDNGGTRRDWGGLVLTGSGFANRCNDPTYCDNTVEGVEFAILYGGTDTNVNCGSVQYVVLANTGSLEPGGNDINALTVYSCDSETTLSHIQSDNAGDDAFEFFGGSAVADHLVATDTLDDNFDTDYGFSGGVQFMLIKQGGTPIDGDKGFEMDNGCSSGVCLDASAHLRTPRSLPNAANVTIMNLTTTVQSGGGISFRTHTGANLWNVIVQNGKGYGIRSETYGGAGGGATASQTRLTNKISLNNVWMYHPHLATDSGTSSAKLRGADATDVTDLVAIFNANANNVLNANPVLNADPMVKAIGYPQQ